MTAEVKSEGTQMAEAVVSPTEPMEELVNAGEEENEVEPTLESEEEEQQQPEEPKLENAEDDEKKELSPCSVKVVQKSSSFKEESNFLSDLKENERKALIELRAKVEEAVLENKLFKEAKKEEEQKPKADEFVDKEEEEVSLWGVPLLQSKGFESTDVVLLKFLRARDFRVKEAFEMLQNALQWRKESKIDSVLDETDLGSDFAEACYMDGVDREGHPVCYNVPGVFQDPKLYQKAFGSEEGRKGFLRWRVQVMEKGIQKLDLRPGGVTSLLQITDLKNSVGPSKKELRETMKQAVQILQDNYPEFVARNIFINVPFWYYAFHALLSPFLTQRTKSKFLFIRPSKATETLLKYIPAENIPIRYGGLKRDNDTEFSVEDGSVSEITIKGSSIETIEIPAPEAGTTLLWDLTVLGWEVNYKEEFVPADEGSYTIIIQKGKKMGSQEEPIRNSFRNNEAGKVVLTIENSTFKKKKVFFRFKSKSC